MSSSSSVDEQPNLEKTGESVSPATKRHNIFHTILQSSLPPQEKTPKRLGQEGVVSIAAGGETCGRMMSNALYYILANKDRVMPTLAQELMKVMPTPDVQPELNALEQLPYLVSTASQFPFLLLPRLFLRSELWPRDRTDRLTHCRRPSSARRFASAPSSFHACR